MFLTILKNSREKHGRRYHLFSKVWSLRLATLLEKRLRHRCFPVNFAKFLKTSFLYSTSGGCFCIFRTVLDHWFFWRYIHCHISHIFLFVLTDICTCSRAGTRYGLCNPFTLLGYSCPCKESYSGDLCDACAKGWHGYPNCKSEFFFSSGKFCLVLFVLFCCLFVLFFFIFNKIIINWWMALSSFVILLL